MNYDMLGMAWLWGVWGGSFDALVLAIVVGIVFWGKGCY